MSRLFRPNPDLVIGHVVEVAGSTLKVELSADVLELTRTYEGRVYPIGQIGSVVKVHFGRHLVFGFVTLLRMESDDPAEGNHPALPQRRSAHDGRPPLCRRSMERGAITTLLHTGIGTYPLPRQGVYLLTQSESSELYEAAERTTDSEDGSSLVRFARYTGTSNTPCRANIDKMFGMHCAVLGSTGSGKSGGVATLLHAVLDHGDAGNPLTRPNIIVVDPHGEYGTAFDQRGILLRAYDPVGSGTSEGDTIHLPYWLMSAEEFRNLVIGKTEHEATSQHNIVYKALTHARMATSGW